MPGNNRKSNKKNMESSENGYRFNGNLFKNLYGKSQLDLNNLDYQSKEQFEVGQSKIKIDKSPQNR